jgi:Holliday junction resolvase
MINSRQKGANGERELARLLEDELGCKFKRNLDQYQDGGFDLKLKNVDECNHVDVFLDKLAIECKRYSKVTESDICYWWIQAVNQTLNNNKIPILAYRKDRESWKFVVPMKILNHDFHVSYALEYCVTLSLKGFCSIVRG